MRAVGRGETCDVSLRLGPPAASTPEPFDRKATVGCGGGGDSPSLLTYSINGPEKEEKKMHHVNLSFSHVTVAWDERSMSDSKESDAVTGAMGACCSRKKMKLTRDQAKLLEESFKSSPSLDPVKKKELARRLKLKPRQVEVWFQNRRARNKMKQTKKDREVLKRLCDSLREENSTLKMELDRLRTGCTTAASMAVVSAVCQWCRGCGSEAGWSPTSQPVQCLKPNQY